jgi:hypothetical protein
MNKYFQDSLEVAKDFGSNAFYVYEVLNRTERKYSYVDLMIETGLSHETLKSIMITLEHASIVNSDYAKTGTSHRKKLFFKKEKN